MSVVLPRLLADLPDLPRARCAGQDPEAWFTTDQDVRDAAAGVCRACPERRPCLQWAVARGERFGTWGGVAFGLDATAAGRDDSAQGRAGAATG